MPCKHRWRPMTRGGLICMKCEAELHESKEHAVSEKISRADWDRDREPGEAAAHHDPVSKQRAHQELNYLSGLLDGLMLSNDLTPPEAMEEAFEKLTRFVEQQEEKPGQPQQ